jgi:hypothetical protein
MKRLDLARHGTALATREAARNIASQLRHLHSGDCQLVLDFNGVTALSPSFADELLKAVLTQNCELWVVGLSEDIYEMLNSVASRRNTSIRPADGDPSRWRLETAATSA